VFNDLILPDDPMDGSRSLRKRKASLEEEAHAPRLSRKKRKSSEASQSDLGANTSIAASSPRALAQNDAASEDESEGDGGPSASEHGSSRLRSRARHTKPKRTDKRPLVWIEENTGPLSLVVVFHLHNETVQNIVTAKPKKKAADPRLEARRERDRERRDRNKRAAQQQAESPDISHYPAIQPHYTAPFHGFVDKEMDEIKNKPFGGILSEADADTSKTYPTQADRKRFEDARLKAEEDWKTKQAALYASQEPVKPLKQAGPPSKIKCINFGGWEIDTWHAAPYPEEYSKNKVLYICEFCLKYMNSDYVAWRHKVRTTSFLCARTSCTNSHTAQMPSEAPSRR
jgi:histone acetyltransferase SAS3